MRPGCTIPRVDVESALVLKQREYLYWNQRLPGSGESHLLVIPLLTSGTKAIIRAIGVSEYIP